MFFDRGSGQIHHRVFSDLPGFLTPRDCLVINRTYVLPAKFVARRTTGGRINGLFVHEHSAGRWTVLLSGVRRLKDGERLTLGSSPRSSPCWMTLLERGERGSCDVAIEPPEPARTVLEAIGTAPLPPYIQRSEGTPAAISVLDREYYQTVYAETPGSIAAPTAGMHFTPALLEKIRGQGTKIADVVLHVGLGTFQPVEVEDLADHHMHSEWYSLSAVSAAAIEQTRAGGGRIVAVGTTAVRVLETCGKAGSLVPQSGWTNLLIYPPYRFAATDAMVTNFHLPGSTLLALVGAFAGHERIMSAYRLAITERYRFYSYGDAMLIV
jgi:S-adenosylmethionine:tRNA ribosyltransferase-isomerase